MPNIIRLSVFLVRFLSLMGTCIDRQRFKTFFKGENQSAASSHYCIERPTNCKQPTLLSILGLLISNPCRLAKMVKQYQMAGNSFLAFVILFTLVLIHNNLKIAIHLIWVGPDPKRLQFAEDIYYASLTGSSTKPAYWNFIYFSNISLNTIVWFQCLYELLRESIINETNYKSISVSQLNLAYLASFQAEPLSGVNNMAKLVKSRNQLNVSPFDRTDAIINYNYEEQLKISEYWFENVELKIFIANFNIIDFSKSYEHLWNIVLPKSQSKDRNNNSIETFNKPYPQFHLSKPRHRMDIDHMLVGIGLIHFILSIQFVGLSMYIILINLMELSVFKNPIDLWIPSKLCKLLRITTIIRNFELITNGIATVRLNYIFMLLIWDSLILISRVKRVSSIALNQVETIRNYDFPVSLKIKMNIDVYSDHKSNNHQCKQMRYILLMARVVVCEFNDLKRRYTKYINILLVGYSICLPQCLATLIVENTLTEKGILTIFTTCILLPLIFLIVCSAILELSVSS